MTRAMPLYMGPFKFMMWIAVSLYMGGKLEYFEIEKDRGFVRIDGIEVMSFPQKKGVKSVTLELFGLLKGDNGGLSNN